MCEICMKREGKGFMIIGDGECYWVCKKCYKKFYKL
jgi:hypothetical protein